MKYFLIDHIDELTDIERALISREPLLRVVTEIEGVYERKYSFDIYAISNEAIETIMPSNIISRDNIVLNKEVIFTGLDTLYWNEQLRDEYPSEYDELQDIIYSNEQ